MSTSIEWTQNPDGSPGKTWNPTRGCSRQSDGCLNCYAMRQAHRFNTISPKSPYHGLTTIRRGKVDWAGMARFIPEQLGLPLKWRKPTRVFVNSMSDLFHPSLSNEEIAAVFGVMAACPQHTFQILTKQPKRAAEWFDWIAKQDAAHKRWVKDVAEAEILCAEDPGTRGARRSAIAAIACSAFASSFGADFTSTLDTWPLRNVWLGVSVEDQTTADDRISILIERIPAAVRFASYEPALGPVSLWAFLKGETRDRCVATLGGAPNTPGLDWVIVGGESGNGARPFDVQWAQSVVEQCRAAEVPCFVKQLGADPIDSSLRDVWLKGQHHYTRPPDDPIVVEALKRPDYRVTPHQLGRLLRHKKGADMSEWPEELRLRQFPEVRT